MSQGEVRGWVMRLRLDDRHVGCADVVRTIEANGGEIETIIPVLSAGETQTRDFFITSRTVRQSQRIIRSICGRLPESK